MLEQVFKFVEAKEAGKRSATRLLIPHGTDALMGSMYRSKKNDPLKEGQAPRYNEQGTKSQGESCSYCGLKGHGKNGCGGRSAQHELGHCMIEYWSQLAHISAAWEVLQYHSHSPGLR